VRDTGLTAADAWALADDRSTWRALRPTAGYAQQWVSEWVSLGHGHYKSSLGSYNECRLSVQQPVNTQTKSTDSTSSLLLSTLKPTIVIVIRWINYYRLLHMEVLVCCCSYWSCCRTGKSHEFALLIRGSADTVTVTSCSSHTSVTMSVCVCGDVNK